MHNNHVYYLLNLHGNDILTSKNMQLEKEFMQHGQLSCYCHSLFVAYISLKIVKALHLNANERSLIRGALLHDYFLYDWHIPSSYNRRHAFSHPRRAYENAIQDFELNELERDIILKHMFPLTLKLPRYRESYIVLLADKYCAVYETLAKTRTQSKVALLEESLIKRHHMHL
jgi:uncharacterized protein